MKANKWMSMALAMALTAGSGVSAYAAEVAAQLPMKTHSQPDDAAPAANAMARDAAPAEGL